jgi:hypothetical protein
MTEDKAIKIYVLKWLCELFGFTDYPHSFKDQFITWNIWNGVLNVGFDFRQLEHEQLFALIHPRFKGTPQKRTLKIVNETSFYLNLDDLLDIEYPAITGHTLVAQTKHKGGKGGWYSESDAFYTYKWKVNLADGSVIDYENQMQTMDLKQGDYIYNVRIQERAFVKYITDKFNKQTTVEPLTKPLSL